MQTGVRIKALADKPLGLGRGQADCKLHRFAERALLGVAELPPAWLSAPSGVNYAVGLREGTGPRRIGVVHVGQGVGDGKVLGE